MMEFPWSKKAQFYSREVISEGCCQINSDIDGGGYNTFFCTEEDRQTL